MKKQRCRVCGCTQNRACVSEDGNCWWVERDLCSACATPAQIALPRLRQRVVALQADIDDPDSAEFRAELIVMQRRYIAACKIRLFVI